MKQNSPWLTLKQPHVLIFLAFESHQLFFFFYPSPSGLHPRNVSLRVMKLWLHRVCLCMWSCIAFVCWAGSVSTSLCHWPLNVPGNTRFGPPAKNLYFFTKWVPFTWPVDSFISTSPFILNQTIAHRLFTSFLVCERAFGGGNNEKAFIFPLNTMSSAFFVPLFSQLWVCCLILAWGSVGVIGPWLHECNSTEWVSGWARNSKSENEERRKKCNKKHYDNSKQKNKC